MDKTAVKNHKQTIASEIDLYDDLAKIKAALAEVTLDVRDRAGEILLQSLDDVKEKSAAVQESVSHYAAEKPFKTIGIALLAGFAIGFLLRKTKG